MKISNIYKLLLAALIIVACDPLADTNKKIEESKTYVDDLVYTLTDDDYELAGENFGSYSDIDDVKATVPLILQTNFPALGKTSSALVSYKFYNGSSPDLNGTYHVATVTTEDYDALGFIYGSFDNATSDVADWANYKYPDAQDGDHADVTFKYYDGSVIDATSRVVYTVAYQWQYTSILPDNEYGDFFSESGIDFSSKSEGAEKMPTYLNYLYASGSDYYSLNLEEGTKIVMQYNFDDRFTDGGSGLPNVPAVALYIFNGAEWISYGDGYQTTTESLNFGHDGTVWVPDNTIKYTFVTADYDVCGDDANGLGNPAARANLRAFGNFGTQWSHAEIIGCIDFILKLNNPGNEVGQKYLVTYNTYPAGDLTDNVILDASGDYIEIVE